MRTILWLKHLITVIDMKGKQVKKKILLNSIASGKAGTDDELIYTGGENKIQKIIYMTDLLKTL